MDYRELDGGVYDNPDITIRQALDEIVTDLKEPTHRSELEGSIRTDDELIPIDYDGLRTLCLLPLLNEPQNLQMAPWGLGRSW